ncbi:MAG TPA: DUF2336 domain-containing protein [Rhizomicrobium sp.]|nr:DUF2336 domain-containing protein [Rhizomicrobium sp.]
MTRLAQLAANPQGTGRDEIYLAVASLYRTQAPQLSDRERALMREILQRLTGDVEMAIRITLAEKLADDEDAPLDLILLLCDDRIEVARPLILRSRKLSDDDLLRLIADADITRQVICAARPNIGEPVSEALAKSDAEPVLVTLLRNVTARIAKNTFETLVEKSRNLPNLHEPLVQRRDLPPTLATRMCDWVSDALKSYIVQNYKIAPSSIDEAAQKIQEPPEAASSASKLIDKLAAAGQLRAGFLLRVLNQNQIELFETAFAKLLNLDMPNLRRVLYDQGPRSVALACRAVGIDRCVFSTVFNLSRKARGLYPTLSPDERADVESVFNVFSRPEAMARIRARA